MPLDALFAPRRVAIVGLDDRGPVSGRRLAERLVAAPFAGELLLIGPAGASCAGRAATPSSDVAPGPVDLVVIAGDPRDTALAVATWTARGARALLVTTDPRVDLDRDDPEGELLARCAAAETRLVGPHARGVCVPARGLALVDADVAVTAGPFAFASTAGGTAFASLLAAAAAAGLGVHEAIDLGAAYDLALPELFVRWRGASEVSVVVLDGLAVGRPAAIIATLRALAREKPVLVTGPDAASLALAGAIPVTDRAAAAHLAADFASRLGAGPLATPRGDGVAVIASDAALGASAAAALEDAGFRLAPLADATRAQLASELHARAVLDNPLDLLATATPRHLRVAARAAAADPAVGAVVVAVDPVPAALDLPADFGGVPVIAAPPEHATALLVALRTFAAAAARPAPGATPPPPNLQPQLAQAVLVGAHLTGRTVLAPEEARRVLTAYGLATLPTLTVAAPHAARRAAAGFGYPVAVTLRADGRSLRATDLTDGDAVEAAVMRLYAEAASHDPRLAFDVQPCVAPVDVTLEARRHPRLGHRLTLRGPASRAEAWLPVAAPDADALVATVLGADASPAASNLLLRLARLVTDLPELDAVRFAPLGLHQGRWVVVDAELHLDPASLMRDA